MAGRSIVAALLRIGAILRLAAPATIAGLTFGACGAAGGGAASAVSKTSGAQAAGTSRTSAAGAHADGGCRFQRSPGAKAEARLAPPRGRLDPAKRYVVKLATNCGAIEVELDVRDSPRTTASFAYLVEHGFYDDLTFHRVASGFVVQGGDPDGDGSGGPDYTVVEPPPANVRYTLGTVAMAKGETDPAGASGSQFFIVTAADAGLPPQYALLGHVVGGLSAVKAIGRLPTDPPQDGAPRTPVVIDSATLAVGR